MVNLFKLSIIVIVSILLAAPIGQSSEWDKSLDLYQVILQLPTNISEKAARKIANSLYKVARDPASRAITWQTILAVALKESTLNKFAISKTHDLGLMQFSPEMIRHLRLNAKKLVLDEEYALRAGTNLLVHNKHLFGHHKYWIGIYNAGTRFDDPEIAKKIMYYHKDVQRKIKLINKIVAKLNFQTRYAFNESIRGL